MTRRITPHTSLDHLKKEAKRRRGERTLREAQHEIAREFGFAGWTELKRALEKPAADPNAIVARFLDYACPDHHVRGRPAHRIARHAALRILEQHPEIARHDLVTAVVCGEIDEVARILREDPDAARRRSAAATPDRTGAGEFDDIFRHIGPKGWEPLLFLCFTRLPLDRANDNAVAIARMLLDHGANPNAFFMAGDVPYSPLSGVIGEGEEDRPPHPHRDALARLLLERGAEPYDEQVLYNIHFRGDVLWYLELLSEFAATRRADAEAFFARYNAPPAHEPGEDDFIAAVREDRADVVADLLDRGHPIEFQYEQQRRPLHLAAMHNAVRVAQLLIERGAEIDPVETAWNNTPIDFAVWHDYPEMIELLAPHTRDIGNLVFLGKIARLREIVAAQPELAKGSALFWLPEDEDAAIAIIDLFVALGADAGLLRKQDNLTAADIARRRGMNEAAKRLESAAAARPRDVASFERRAEDLVTAYANGDADVRATAWRLLYKVRRAGAAAEAFGLAEAQELIARTSGFSNWTALTDAIAKGAPPEVPAYAIADGAIRLRRNVEPHEWDTILAVMRELRLTALATNGVLHDDALRRIAALPDLTRLDLSGSQNLTEDGWLTLAAMPQLEHLTLSGKITDRALELLRHLQNLRIFEMTWQRGISDAGLANLKFCERIEHVNVMGTPSGDGLIEALRGKPRLQHLDTGKHVTDAGLALLRELPRLQQLLIDGPFTNDGFAVLAQLEAVSALDVFWNSSAITSEAFAVLSRMPQLATFGCDGTVMDDRAMQHMAAIPRLTALRAQDASATDDGFIALSRSPTLERLWARDSLHLTGRGFVALSKMPALHALGVPCNLVDDDALSTLPQFPSLRELTAIGIHDDGFRHIGRCAQLEFLQCMYCRDTTDAATEHIAGLQLKSYYAGLTQITDRTLEILGRMQSLESVDLYETKRVTDAGLVHLAALPRLREIHLFGIPNVTLAGTAVFPPNVKVDYNA